MVSRRVNLNIPRYFVSEHFLVISVILHFISTQQTAVFCDEDKFLITIFLSWANFFFSIQVKVSMFFFTYNFIYHSRSRIQLQLTVSMGLNSYYHISRRNFVEKETIRYRWNEISVNIWRIGKTLKVNNNQQEAELSRSANCDFYVSTKMRPF